MEKGYYVIMCMVNVQVSCVAIHNKNGKGLLLKANPFTSIAKPQSQSTIKMEKGYYLNKETTNYCCL